MILLKKAESIRVVARNAIAYCSAATNAERHAHSNVDRARRLARTAARTPSACSSAGSRVRRVLSRARGNVSTRGARDSVMKSAIVSRAINRVISDSSVVINAWASAESRVLNYAEFVTRISFVRSSSVVKSNQMLGLSFSKIVVIFSRLTV